MRKFLIAAFLVFVVLGSLCRAKIAWGISEEEEVILDKPKVEITPAAWDFGKIKEGEIKTYEFEARNVGDKELIITNTFSSCGCTKVSISSTNILPQDSAKLKVSFDSKGFAPGRTERIIYVNSNDPDEPVKKVIVSAEIESNAK
ncbi:MAG: DUF1573 domain-containing protein [Candidatus Omnitrophota bacterium]